MAGPGTLGKIELLQVAELGIANQRHALTAEQRGGRLTFRHLVDALVQPLHCDDGRLSAGNIGQPLFHHEVMHAGLRLTELHQQRFGAAAKHAAFTGTRQRCSATWRS